VNADFGKRGRGQTCRRRAEKRRTLEARVVRLTPFRFGEPKAGETAKILRRASERAVYKHRARFLILALTAAVPRFADDGRPKDAQDSNRSPHKCQTNSQNWSGPGFSMNDGIE
jgi:hypothetical protein